MKMGHRYTRRAQGFRRTAQAIVAALSMVVAGPGTAPAETRETPPDDVRGEAEALEPQAAGLARLRAASRTPVYVRFERGFARSVRARVPVEGRNAVERADAFLRQFADLYGPAHP